MVQRKALNDVRDLELQGKAQTRRRDLFSFVSIPLRHDMPAPPPSPAASPLFLREEEIRRGIELLHFGQAELARAMDAQLDAMGLGRADQRALYFIARSPGLSVSALLKLLGVTKQSLGRVLDPLIARGLVEMVPGTRDRRQRLLRLTAEGARIEAELFATARERMAQAYSQAGQGSVTGFWRVLETLIAPEDRAMVAALQIRG